MAQIFLCYASEDETQVRDIHRRLQGSGFQPWMDKIDLLPGQRWDREIRNALRASDFILVFFSRHSIAKRGFIQREFKLALDILAEIPEEAIFTIPVRLDDCEIPEQFKGLQWANLFDELGFERIIQGIQAGLKQRQPQNKLIKEYEMEFVLIPDGTFVMGYESGRPDEKPVHNVTISKPFYMGVSVVTQGQWKAVMGTEPWRGKDYVLEDSQAPASWLSWYNANEFTKRLTLKDKANSHRLPTEAEWEYAARAGTEKKFSFGNDENLLNAYGWYNENAYDIEEKYPHIVKQLKPNSWGLYDMHGNVWEWVADWHGAYLEDPVVDPTGPKTGSSRVLRGGAFDYAADGARSAFRADNSPNRRLESYGFRIVMFPL